MIDPTIATIIGSVCAMIPPTVMALAAWRQAKVNAKKTDENTALTAETKTGVDRVEKLADGNFKRMQEELKSAHEEIRASQDEIKKLHTLVGKLLEANGHNGKTRRSGDAGNAEPLTNTQE